MAQVRARSMYIHLDSIITHTATWRQPGPGQTPELSPSPAQIRHRECPTLERQDAGCKDTFRTCHCEGAVLAPDRAALSRPSLRAIPNTPRGTNLAPRRSPATIAEHPALPAGSNPQGCLKHLGERHAACASARCIAKPAGIRIGCRPPGREPGREARRPSRARASAVPLISHAA
jgi:hypothetical protein